MDQYLAVIQLEKFVLNLSLSEIEIIASKIYEEGFMYSEAYPIKRWAANGWPENVTLYKIIDAYLKLFRSLEEYGIKNSSSVILKRRRTKVI